MPRQFRQPSRPSIYDSAAPRQSPDISTPLKKALITFENSIRHDSVETGAFFDAAGNETIRRSGQADQVSFDDVHEQLLRGMHFSHNHPGGGNFSVHDLLTAAQLNLLELRVVTPSLRFSMQAGQRNWPERTALLTCIRELRPQAMLRAQLSVARGDLDPIHGQAQAEHELMRLLAEHLRLRYSRERS